MKLKKYLFIAIIVIYSTSGYSQLTHIKSYYDKEGGVQGLDGPVYVQISPDNKNVYLVTRYQNSLVNFKRDSLTGNLFHVQTFYDGQNGIDGIVYGSSIAVSYNNRFIYVSSGAGAITLFSLENNSDSISYIRTIKDDSIANLYGATSICFSTDNKNLYLTSDNNNALLVFSFDTSTGDIQLIEEFIDGQNGIDGLYGANFVRASRDNKSVYVTGRMDDAISVFTRDTVTGNLTFLQSLSYWQPNVDCIQKPSSLALSNDDKYVYVTSYYDAVAVFSRNMSTGSLTYDTCSYGLQLGGTIDGLNGASSIMVTNDNKRVYVSSEYDGMAVFDRNEITGELTFTQAVIDDQNNVNYMEGAKSLTISNNDKFVYVVAEDDNAINSFETDTVNDTLILLQTIMDNYGGIDGIYRANRTALSPDNNYLYVASDDAVAVFKRNDTTGTLQYIQAIKQFDISTSIYDAKDIVISPDGKNAYAACSFKILVFDRDTTNGFLFPLQIVGSSDVGGCIQHVALAIRSDGKFLYSASSCGINDGIVTLLRDTLTGILSFVDLTEDNVNGNDGLHACESIIVSPDDKYLYAASPNDHSVARYSINDTSGILSFTEMIQSSFWDNHGLDCSRHVTISLDNKTVYVASNANGSGGLVVLTENDTSGNLSIIQTIFDDWYVNGLRDPTAIEISPDNQTLYVTSSFQSVINIFKRDTITGYLEHVKTVYDTDVGVEGIDPPNSITIDDNNRNLYVASLIDNAVTQFKISLYVGDTIYACVGDTLVLRPNKEFQNYYWLNDSSTNYQISVFESGIYTLTTTDIYGIIEEDSVNVIFYLPEVDLGSDTTIYFGDDITLTPGFNFSNYLWQDSSTSFFYYIKNESSNYDTLLIYVLVQDLNGCFNSDTIIVYLNPTLNILENNSYLPIIFYPNPSHGIFNIHNPQAHKLKELNIYTAEGKLLLSKTNFLNSSIDISSCANGIYSFEVKTEEKIQIYKIIIIK